MPVASPADLAPITTPELFPDAPTSYALEIPEAAPRAGRLQRAISELQRLIDGSGPSASCEAPVPAFWNIYGRQRGLERCEDLWAREVIAPVLRGSSSLQYAATLRGQIDRFDAFLIACARRPTGRRRVPSAAYLVLGTRLPWQSVADQRTSPARPGTIGWSLLRGSFAAWLEVPAARLAEAPSTVAPAVDEACIDWFCLQASAAATTCAVGRMAVATGKTSLPLT